jgi:putative ABC transport system permease protein
VASPAFSEIIGMATEALRSNKLRTSLTMLGVVIGISSVIAITSVGQGVQKATEAQLQSLGTDILIVLAGSARAGFVTQGIGSSTTLTWDDAKAVAEQAPAAKGVASFLRASVRLVYQGSNTITAALGTEAHFPDVRTFYPQQGRFFTADEINTNAQVAVLGYKVRDRLFKPGEDFLNATVRIQGERYTVIGVMEPKGSSGVVDQDDQIYIPLSTMASRIVGSNAVSGVAVTGFWLKAANPQDLEAAQFQATNLLRLRHDIHPPQEDDFNITSQTDLLSTLNTIVSLFTVMVVAIGSISLVVGGIGIANIMLVSVVERTREIGVRKALGATDIAILSQFLTESIVVSLLGGIVGTVAGIGIAFAAATGLKLPFVVAPESIASGFGLSFAVGLVAGVIPARNAAKLDPIAALRSD